MGDSSGLVEDEKTGERKREGVKKLEMEKGKRSYGDSSADDPSFRSVTKKEVEERKKKKMDIR